VNEGSSPRVIKLAPALRVVRIQQAVLIYGNRSAEFLDSIVSRALINDRIGGRPVIASVPILDVQCATSACE
jgi:hypothetical protein